MKKVIILSFFFFFLASSNLYSAGTTTHHLPSGKQVKIKGLGKIFFKNSKPALAFEYETDIKLDNDELLRKEAEEIWPVFRVNVEKEKMENAVIKASEPQKKTGIISYEYSSYSFVIKRKKNNTWQFHKWGRDYEDESKKIALGLLSSLEKRDYSGSLGYFHYPESFSKAAIESENKKHSYIISVFSNKFGKITNYALNNNPIHYNFFALQTASPQYWNKYPYFCSQIYDVKYDNSSNGYIVFRFSIINSVLELHSVLFGFPSSDSSKEAEIRELIDELTKALNKT